MRKLTLGHIPVLAVCVLAIVAAEELVALDGADVASMPGERMVLPTGRAVLLEVIPQVPDGPVVQKFKKLQAKKKLDQQVVKQSKILKPVLKRKKVKKRAQKSKMAMLADLEIKNRKSKNELKLKAKARRVAKEKEARKQAAKKRRTERYEKANFDAMSANKESLQKLHTQTSGALKAAHKLYRAQKARSKKLAAQQIAKMKAQGKENLLVGGVIHLSGNQLANKMPTQHLMKLNGKLATAMQHPTAHNIRMAQVSYDYAAMAVGRENEHYKVLARNRKGRAAQIRENERKKKKSAKDRAVKHVARMIAHERRAKRARQERVRKAFQLGREQNSKHWAAARGKVNRARAALKNAESAAKRRFNEKMSKRQAEKTHKAPMEAWNKSKAVLRERGHKLTKAKKPAQKFIAKTMRERALKRMKERGKKSHAHYNRRRRRINVRRRRYNYRRRRNGYRRRRYNYRRRRYSRNVRNVKIKLRAGYCLRTNRLNRSGSPVSMYYNCNANSRNLKWDYNSATGQIKNHQGICLDASQRNTHGGRVHMWGCNTGNWNQQWTYSPQTGRIKNRHGICLHATRSRSNGARVNMARCANGVTQMWSITGFRL